jgi:hypothetical protein
MIFILVSTWQSLCSDCGGSILKPNTVTTCRHCGVDFDGVMMLVDTGKAFHETLPHHAPMDHPHVDANRLTWCRPWNARLPYEVVPA